EAGPTGYGLARRSRRGLEISVCAPGEIAGGGGAKSRIKTDARDALKLARLHMAGELTLVVVPSVEQEQVRDLVRAREDVRADLMRARHRLGKFLLRRERYFPGRDRAWTAVHRDWLASLVFDDLPSEATFADYLHAHDTLLARRDRLDEHIEQTALTWSLADEVARLRCLRGIDTLSAMGLVAETRGCGALTARAMSRRSSVSFPASTPQATSAASARSPRPAHHTPAGSSSKPPGTIASRHG